MSAFLLSLVVALIADMASRAQQTVARYTSLFGPHRGLLWIVVIAAFASATIGMLAGRWIGDLMPVDAKQMFVAVAFVWSGIAMAWPRQARRAEREPTRSLGAVGLVLTMQLMLDGKLMLVALAAFFSPAYPVAAGGAIGGVLALTLAWQFGEKITEHGVMRTGRVVAGIGVATTGLVVGLMARSLM